MSILGRLRAGRLLSRGQALREAGKPAEACTKLERALALAPGDHGARIHLALAKADAGAAEDGLALLDAGADAFGEPEILMLFRGILLLEAGRTDEAAETFAAAAEKASDNRLIGGYRALCRINAGDIAGGVAALKDGGLPENFDFQRRLAVTLERRLFLDRQAAGTALSEPEIEEGDDPDAPHVPDAMSGTDAPPPVPDAPGIVARIVGWPRLRWLTWRANGHYDKERYERALPLYRAAVQLAPRDPTLLAYHGSALLLVGHYDEARAVLLTRMQLTEGRDLQHELDIPAAACIGQTFYHQGHLEPYARKWFQYAQQLEQSRAEAFIWPDASYFIALLLLHKGQRDEARALFRRIEGMEPGYYQRRITTLFKIALEVDRE